METSTTNLYFCQPGLHRARAIASVRLFILPVLCSLAPTTTRSVLRGWISTASGSERGFHHQPA